MTLIRARQPVVTRVSPHNANKKYLVTRGKKFSPVPLPVRADWEYEFRTATAGQNATINIPVTIDTNTSGYLDLDLFWYQKASADSRIINNDRFFLYFQNNNLICRCNLFVQIVDTIANFADLSFKNIHIEWSPKDATTMQAAYFRDGLEITVWEFPVLLPLVADLILAGSPTVGAFYGVIRNLVYYSDVTGKGDGWYIDDNSNTVKHIGAGAGGNGSVVVSGSSSGWQEQSNDILSITPNYPANLLDIVYLECGLDQAFNSGASILGWSVKLNNVTDFPIASITLNNDRLRGVQLATTHVVVPGTDYLQIAYNKALAPAPPNAMNVPSFNVRVDIV